MQSDVVANRQPAPIRAKGEASNLFAATAKLATKVGNAERGPEPFVDLTEYRTSSILGEKVCLTRQQRSALVFAEFVLTRRLGSESLHQIYPRLCFGPFP